LLESKLSEHVDVVGAAGGARAWRVRPVVGLEDGNACGRVLLLEAGFKHFPGHLYEDTYRYTLSALREDAYRYRLSALRKDTYVAE
jgi:hypothetical protein